LMGRSCELKPGKMHGERVTIWGKSLRRREYYGEKTHYKPGLVTGAGRWSVVINFGSPRLKGGPAKKKKAV